MADPILVESIGRLHALIDQARVRGENENNAATLATADAATGRPSARTVHVHVDEDSLAFFVNARTGKGSQLATNPQAALCFFWRALAQQVVVDGGVVVLSDAQANMFWQQRSRATALGARASKPEADDADKSTLDARVKDQRSRADFARIKKPTHWVGYRLQPDRIVFWETGWERMRLRHAVERRPDGQWWAGDRQP